MKNQKMKHYLNICNGSRIGSFTCVTGFDSVHPPTFPPQSVRVGKPTVSFKLWYFHSTAPTLYHQWLFLLLLKALWKAFFPFCSLFSPPLFFGQVYILWSKVAFFFFFFKDQLLWNMMFICDIDECLWHCWPVCNLMTGFWGILCGEKPSASDIWKKCGDVAILENWKHEWQQPAETKITPCLGLQVVYSSSASPAWNNFFFTCLLANGYSSDLIWRVGVFPVAEMVRK